MTRRFPWVSAAAVVLLVAVALAAPWLNLPNPVRMAMTQRMAPPSALAWLGRDEYGRDVLSRIIWGARSSLAVAFAAAALAAAVGTALGVLGGFLRGLVELATLRAPDVLLCFPPLLLALLLWLLHLHVSLGQGGLGLLSWCAALLAFTSNARPVAMDGPMRPVKRPEGLPWLGDRL